MARTTVAVVLGTRPEAIKLAPVVGEPAESWWAAPEVVVTGQHGKVVDEVLGAFDLKATVRLPDAAGSPGLGDLGAGMLDRLNRVVDALWRMTAGAPPYEPDEARPGPHTGGPRRGVGRLIVVTAHRRESWGEAIRRVGRAVARLARLLPDLTIVLRRPADCLARLPLAQRH